MSNFKILPGMDAAKVTSSTSRVAVNVAMNSDSPENILPNAFPNPPFMLDSICTPSVIQLMPPDCV